MIFGNRSIIKTAKDEVILDRLVGKKRLFKTMFRTVCMTALLAGLAGLLSGCLYPGEQRTDRRVSYMESVDRLQRAVDQFQSDQGILPIITAGDETPRYEKYRIDLELLLNRGYLEQIPLTAFEKGGSAYFLIIDEENDPTVKVMDLLTVQKVNDVQRLVDQYRKKHDGMLPVDEQQPGYDGLHIVNLEQAGAENYEMVSVYSGQSLNYLIDDSGNVYVDYAFDIMQAMGKSTENPPENTDLREVLTNESYFVPVKSLPYRLENGMPVPHTD